MNGNRRFHHAVALITLLFAGALWPSIGSAAELHEETVKAWNLYKKLTEARIEEELGSSEGFLVREFLPDSDAAKIRTALARGDIFIRKLETRDEEGGKIKIPKGLVHHWYGSVLVPKISVDELLAWIQDYDSHQEYFEEVEDSRLVSRQGTVFEIFLRLRRKKIITVHYHTDHVVTYSRSVEGNASSRSEATRIAELKDPGKEREREIEPGVDDRGYLWRLNSYWRFKQVPEGVVVECESISLSRTIPAAFRWVVKPFITSVPKESLEAALRPMRVAFAQRSSDE
jgi:hypothetical protein